VLRPITILLSVLLHGAMFIPLMGHSAGNRSFEIGTGDDMLRIEQGIALEGISQFGDAAETIEAQEVVELAESRAAQEIEEVKTEEPPPEETPVEELKPEDPPELTDVITTAEARPEPESVPVEIPPPVEVVKPTEVKELEPQKHQIAAIEQSKQVRIEEAKSSSARQSGGNATITTAYLGSLRALIEKNKINPRSRKRGTAVVRFKISSEGKLLSREIKTTSGSRKLDKAALDAVKRAAPFPAFPAGVGIKSLTVTQPFKFTTR
jgi:periplasmic protein TonB